MASSSEGNGSSSVNGRLVLQQCLSAKLMVQPATHHQDAQYVEIERGLIAYVCFMKGATYEVVDKMVKCVLNTRLSSGDNGKLVSILDLPGSILVVPQATLGGRLKGRMMQYHGNIDKTLGLQLYKHFIQHCEEALQDNGRCKECGTVLKYGTYGNRQVLSSNTNGPYTHLVDF